MTDEELARVRKAYRQVADMAVWEGLADDKARGERPALLRLMKAWNKLDIEERAAVSFELSQMVSPDADPHDIDVGLAATRAAEYGVGRAGDRTGPRAVRRIKKRETDQ